jgi:hypothetical protein
MIELIKLNTEDIIPSIADFTTSQGIPKSHVLKNQITDLFEKSLRLFFSEADPSCIIREISQSEFDEIFIGDGNNEEEAPLKNIYPRADHLSLFAITMGNLVSQGISELFSNNDYALASILNTVASCAAEKSVELLEKRITQKLIQKQLTTTSSMVLSYSPGYCGWHISAQKKLFLFLHPEKIGIFLNESCLMTPLKSVTGILINCEKNIHDFDNRFSFCYNCKAQTCITRRERIRGN